MLKLAVFVGLLGLLSVLSPASGGMLPGKQHDDHFFTVFLWRKMMAQCYGPEFEYAGEIEMRAHFTKCYMQAAMQTAEPAKPEEEQPLSVKQKRSVDDSLAPAENSDAVVQDEEKTNFMAPPAHFYNADIVRGIKNDVLNNVKIVSCLFDTLNLTISANGTVDASSLIERYASDLSIPEVVKGFLVEGIRECEAKSNEGNFNVWGQKYYDFHKLLKFFRCADGEKVVACVKTDYKMNAAMYDLEGLDGELSDIDDIAKRYFVSSAYANWDRTGLWDM